jgi:hypothetical protein
MPDIAAASSDFDLAPLALVIVDREATIGASLERRKCGRLGLECPRETPVRDVTQVELHERFEGLRDSD